MRLFEQRFMRFLFAGGLNTVITYLIYLLLLQFLHYIIAYSITYVLGVILSFLLNSLFVFRTKLTLSNALKYPLVYLVQYLSGCLILYVCVTWLGVPAAWAGIVVVVINVPVVYLMNRWILS